MRLVALFALHPHHFYVDVMFTHIRDILMAVETIAPFGPRLCMGVVACVTGKLHRCVGGNIYLDRLFDRFLIGLKVPYVHGAICDELFSHLLCAVAEEAFFPSRPEVLGPVGMTVETGEFSHSFPVDHLALMASHTESLFRGEFVHNVPVAF